MVLGVGIGGDFPRGFHFLVVLVGRGGEPKVAQDRNGDPNDSCAQPHNRTAMAIFHHCLFPRFAILSRLFPALVMALFTAGFVVRSKPTTGIALEGH